MTFCDDAVTSVVVLKVGESRRGEGTVREGALDQSNHADTAVFDSLGLWSEFPTKDDTHR